jgi:hypothetical protein
MNEEDNICENCGEMVEGDIYACEGCGNSICDMCSQICRKCKEYFCDACYIDHKSECGK